MRLVIISDTHGMHEELGTLSGDVLIHCGDFCNGFLREESDLEAVDRWFGQQAFRQVLCVGGNHDFVAQRRNDCGEAVFENATYLQDEGCEIDGVCFFGSPWVPDLFDWAYSMPDEERRNRWSAIPAKTDVLITHTPPWGILDRPRTGNSVGCSYLRTSVEEIAPTIHCFGHVHASFGRFRQGQSEFLNASMVDSNYRLVREPFIVEI